MLKRLKNNKGFTLVEIIVVIAIIAIMSGAFVFVMSTMSSKSDEAKQYARSFYYSAQETMTELKLDVNRGLVSGTAPITTGKQRVICLHVSAQGALSSFQYADGASAGALRAATLTAVLNTDTNWSGVYSSLSKVVSACEKDSWYYAVIDDHYCVVSTYWSETDYVNLKAASFKFTGDCNVNGAIVGAYPISACASGKEIFG